MPAPEKLLLAWTLPTTSSGLVDPFHVIGQCLLDAVVNEQHSKSATVTDHQVETGTNVTDHIRPLPDRLTIEGIITNTPMDVPVTQADGVTGSVQNVQATVNGYQVNYRALVFTGDLDRVRRAFGDLGDAIATGALFSITTTLAHYDNYACESFEATRNADKGNALHFTAGFKQIRFVNTVEVAALPGKAKNRGAKIGRKLDEKKSEDAPLISVAKAFVSRPKSTGGGS